LRALRLELVREHLPGLDPLIQAVLADAKPGRHLDHLVASFGDLLDRFGLEFFRGLCLLIAHLLGLRFEAQRCLENPVRFMTTTSAE
jgi:hypothetical protein